MVAFGKTVETRGSLSRSEWTLLAIFLVVMASLVFISKVSIRRASDAIGKVSHTPEEILITIDGAVKNPGEYRVPFGSALGPILRKAKPSFYADLGALPLKKALLEPAHFSVSELKEVCVKVTGEVLEPVQLTLPIGSRVSDLKSKIGFTPEADKRFFRSRKKLRNGDEIVVPKKTVEGK